MERPPLSQRRYLFHLEGGRHLHKGYPDGTAAPLLISFAGAADSFIKDNQMQRPPHSQGRPRFYLEGGRPFNKGQPDGAAAPLTKEILISIAAAADSFIKDN